MSKLSPGEINVAVVATPKSPVGETGGGEVFTGALANALAEEGFPVRIYGQEDPVFAFHEGVEYVPVSPTTDTIVERDRVGLRRAINETGIAAPLRIALDIAESSPDSRWAIIDNDTTSAPLVPLLGGRVPHVFVQHMAMTTQSYDIYSQIRVGGGKVVAIADYQRESVERQFGDLHDVTIKNGIRTQDLDDMPRIPHRRGESIHVGTLSRVEPTDIKGINFAVRAVERLQLERPAHLTIAGPCVDRATYESVIAPHLGKLVSYVGEKRGAEKTEYLSQLQVGAALSNPGQWNGESFAGSFEEGNSLTLHEMIYAGAIPVSTDSGGAEPMKDAGLGEFVVQMDVIAREGVDAFIALAAKRMQEAANSQIELADLRRRVRTMSDVGRDYADYLLDLVSA